MQDPSQIFFLELPWEVTSLMFSPALKQNKLQLCISAPTWMPVTLSSQRFPLPSSPFSSICLLSASTQPWLCGAKTGPLLADQRPHQQHPLPGCTKNPGWAGGAFKSPSKSLFIYSTWPSLRLGDQPPRRSEGKHCCETILSALITEGWQVIC